MTTKEKQWDALIDQLKLSRRDFVFSGLAAGALTLAPRFASAQAGATYKLGVLLPSTGVGANYMAHCIKGLPLAVAALNKRGGLLGKHQVQIVYRDTETKPDVGSREAKSLILNDKVNAIFGTYSSAVALAVQEIIHEHKVLHFAATSNSSKITQENYTPYTYQFCPDSNMQSGAVWLAVSKMAKKNNWKTFVSIAQDYEWGRDTHKGFTTGLAKVAPKVKEIRQLWFKLGETDFTSYITAIMAAKPDFLYGAIAGKDGETFMQQAGPMGHDRAGSLPVLRAPERADHAGVHQARPCRVRPRGLPGRLGLHVLRRARRAGAGSKKSRLDRHRGDHQSAQGCDHRHLPRQARFPRLQ